MDQFEFIIVNPAFAGSMRGMKILQQAIPMRTSCVKVQYRYD